LFLLMSTPFSVPSTTSVGVTGYENYCYAVSSTNRYGYHF
jgi:hypothetical protein